MTIGHFYFPAGTAPPQLGVLHLQIGQQGSWKWKIVVVEDVQGSDSLLATSLGQGSEIFEFFSGMSMRRSFVFLAVGGPIHYQVATGGFCIAGLNMEPGFTSATTSDPTVKRAFCVALDRSAAALARLRTWATPA